jgi:guanine nucleotide-binding protein subunit beta-2-like 1 protein
MVESRDENAVEFRGYLEKHNGWVTAMQFGEAEVNGQTKQFLISGGRDNNIIVWDLEPKKDGDEEQTWGHPRKTLVGHSHFISDLCLSQDSRFALSSSWDCTMRLWDISKGTTTSRFINHTRDVLTTAFSPDNRQIASGGRDKQLKIWNIMGECKYTVDNNSHQDWVTSVRFHQDTKNPIVVSASCDKTVKVWDNHTMTLKHTFVGHKAPITAIDMHSNYLATASKDGIVMSWNVNEGTFLAKIDCDDQINAIRFNVVNKKKV